MIRLNVFVRVNESNREEAIKAAKELTACSLKEEGCIAYDTFESSTRPQSCQSSCFIFSSVTTSTFPVNATLSPLS